MIDTFFRTAVKLSLYGMLTSILFALLCASGSTTIPHFSNVFTEKLGFYTQKNAVPSNPAYFSYIFAAFTPMIFMLSPAFSLVLHQPGAFSDRAEHLQTSS